MCGDTMHGDAATHYERGYNDTLDGEQEYTEGMTDADLAQYRAGVEDARNTGHLCCWIWIMQPRTEANDGG